MRGHHEVAGYHGPLTLTGLGAPPGEPGWFLAPSFLLRSPVPMQPSSALTAHSYPCCLVSISTLLPLAPTGQEEPCGICPPSSPVPVGTVDWGRSQETVLVTVGTARAAAAWASSPFTHRALPLPGLELRDARVPQPGEVARPPVIAQHVPIVCFSVASTVCAWGAQQAPCEYARGLRAAPAASGFTFPSLDPSFPPR